MTKAILSNRLYVPKWYVQEQQLQEYTYHLPENAEGEEPVVENYLDFGEQIGFCRGNIDKAYATFDDLEIDDQRTMVPFPQEYKLKPNIQLKPEQKEVYKQWIKYGYGIIEAPPRWGKTCWTVYLTCKLKQRAFVFVHTLDLLGQWVEAFQKFTNVLELEEQYGRKLIGAWDWTEHYPLVTLCTYQSFLRGRGKKELNKMRDMYGLVVTDECHVAQGPGFSRVLNKMNPFYRLGVTATPYRSKDELHVIVHDTIGPVVAKGRQEALTVKWNFVHTDKWIKNYRDWTQYINALEKDDERNELIARWVIQDAREGHYILVTTERMAHCAELKSWILRYEPALEGKIEILNGSVPKKKREPLREKCRKGEIRILIAMNRIVQLGYNVPRWSCFHNTMPLTNPENWYQRISRIRTPYSEGEAQDYGPYDKPHPVARVYLDNGNNGFVYGYKNCVRTKNEELGFQELMSEKLEELDDDDPNIY